MNELLKQIELDLVYQGCTSPFDYIAMEEQKKKQRQEYFSKAIAEHPDKDIILTKGRFITALVPFYNDYYTDRVEETVCCIFSCNNEIFTCFAYLPFVFISRAFHS